LDVSDIPTLIAATTNTPLRQLSLKIHVPSALSSDITLGPTGLDTLCIHWDTDTLYDADISPSLVHLYALITPSLPSLSHLELNLVCGQKNPKSEFDLTLLKAAGGTMRGFLYERDIFSEEPTVIGRVVEVFPNLAKLTLLEYIAWNVSTIVIPDD
jgi:hypothetical protein